MTLYLFEGLMACMEVCYNTYNYVPADLQEDHFFIERKMPWDLYPFGINFLYKFQYSDLGHNAYPAGIAMKAKASVDIEVLCC